MKNEKLDSQMILKSLQELVEAGKDTDQRMKDTDQRMKDTDQRMKDTDQRMKDTDQYIKQISKKIDKLQDIVGGMGNSQGLAAEEEFFNSFAKTMSLGNLKFHAIDRNLRRHSNGLQDEFDIVLTNSELIMIVEVKYNFHPNDVQKVINKISNYKKLYPQHHNFNIYGAIAGKVLSCYQRSRILPKTSDKSLPLHINHALINFG